MADFNDLELKWAKFTFGRSARIRFYEQIETSVENNLSVRDALESIWASASDDGRKPKHPEALIAQLWLSRIRNGQSFGQAIRDCVPADEQMLIEAGELGGNFSKALRDVVEIIEKQGAVKGALVGGLAYPTFLAFVLIGMCWLFGYFVIPPFEMALPSEKWTGLAAGLAVMSRVVQAGTIPFLVVMVALIVLYFATLKRWTGRTRAFFDRYPPWSMYRMFVGAGFMISLSALIRADVPMPKALEKLREGADPYLEARITAALRGVMNGVNIGEALYQSGYGFPDPQIVRDLRIYGQMTGFSEMLDKISKRWVDRAAKRIGSIAATLNALMLVALGGILVFVAFGLFAITNQISQAAMFSV